MEQEKFNKSKTHYPGEDMVAIARKMDKVLRGKK